MDTITLYEANKVGENAYEGNGPIRDTQVIVHEVLPNGKKIFRECGRNKINLSGAIYHAHKDFCFGSVGPLYKDLEHASDKYVEQTNVPSYDTIFADTKVNRPFYLPTGAAYPAVPELERRIFVFAVGIDGCGLEDSRKFVVEKDHWIDPLGPSPTAETPDGDDSYDRCIIPFRYVPISPAETGYTGLLDQTDGLKYFGVAIEQPLDGSTQMHAGYYFKAFDNAPVLRLAYSDGTVITQDGLYPADSKYPGIFANKAFRGQAIKAECIVELTLTVSAEDCAEWFSAVGKDSERRVNTISLVSAIPRYNASNELVGLSDFIPVTKYNMSNRSLTGDNSGLQITYLLYY